MPAAAHLDHLAIGTAALGDGWELFGGVLGGTYVFGGDAPGFWWGQLQFSSGPKIELLSPTTGPDAAFLERFLSSRGPGPHHYNFSTPDILHTLAKVAEQGIHPVQANLDSDTWKEAFLHPKTAHGIVIQVAQAAGPGPSPAPVAGFPAPGHPSSLALIEHHVTDLVGATRLFQEALDGQVTHQEDSPAGPSVTLTWPGAKHIRLIQPASGDQFPGGGALHHVRFTRPASFTPAESERAQLLSDRLGLTIELVTV